jgi:hypothetical protein
MFFLPLPICLLPAFLQIFFPSISNLYACESVMPHIYAGVAYRPFRQSGYDFFEHWKFLVNV